MIRRCEDPFRSPHWQGTLFEYAERLWGSDLVNQVQVNIDDCRLALVLWDDDMSIPDLVKQRRRFGGFGGALLHERWWLDSITEGALA